MHRIEDDPVAEVHKIREDIMNEYGSFKKWNEHLLSTIPELKRKGWKFAEMR